MVLRKDNMKKIVITVSDNPDKETCSVNVKLEDNKKSSEQEKITASTVYNLICEKLKEMKESKN